MTGRRVHVNVLLLLVAWLLACDDNSTGLQVRELGPTPGLDGFPARLDALRIHLRIPGIGVAIAKDGRVVWSRGLGQADMESGRLATGATPFHLASLTKPFASTILMGLVEEGLVDLDDPASDYGVIIPGSRGITVRHLLTHTSEGVPGSGYSYNGSRFANLDQVIRSAAGRSFGELLVERIVDPLNLRNSAPNPKDEGAFALSGLDRGEFLSAMAPGYEVRGSEIRPREHPDYFGTAAGLVASAEDVAAFSVAIDQGRFLSPETWERVFTPTVSNSGETLPYGLGWFIQDHQGVRLQWHYGYWTTNSSLIVRAPDKGLTFVVLANTPGLSSPYGLGIDNNVLRSEAARLFVDAFVLGNEALPG